MEKNWNQVLSLIKIRSGVDLFQELKRISSSPLIAIKIKKHKTRTITNS